MNQIKNDNKRGLIINKVIFPIVATLLAVAFVALGVFMLKTVTRKPQNINNMNKVAANLVTASPQLEEESEEPESEEAVVQVTEEDVALNKAVMNGLVKADLSLESKYVAVMSEDGTILFGKNEEKKMNPASMTKLMTALLVVENEPDLSKLVQVSQKTMDYTYEEEGSNAGFVVDEKASILDMLYGVLLPSGAESSVTLAEHIAGSHEDFVDMMNERAEELGMSKTHFTNCVGFYNKEHYTTTKDIAVLLNKCLQNDLLKEIMSQKSHTVGKTNKHKQGFTFFSTVFKKVKKVNLSGIEFLGGKTGYTDESGQCLASAAEINGKQYILVTGLSRTAPDGIAGSAMDVQTVYQKIKAITK